MSHRVNLTTFLVSCICRIERYKGVFDLAEVVAELSSSYPQLKLAIVGIGPDYEEFFTEWGSHPAVEAMGRAEEVDTLLAASDLFAMPSHEEGFGLVYVEAAHHSVASIAGDLPTVREVVLDGETGWLVPPGDKAAIKGALLHALTEPEELARRGRGAREHARNFELGRVVDQLEAVYDEVLGKRTTK